MGATYETDVVAWANEQAALLRSGQFSAIDIENIAEEILDVGKSEQRALASRMAVLLAICSSGNSSQCVKARAGKGRSKSNAKRCIFA